MIDEDGGVRVGASKTLAQARELHQHLAFQGAEALLLRNPRDFDEPELVQALFSQSAQKKAASLRMAEAKNFDELQIQQKPLVSRIDIRQSGPGEFHAQVTGELVRVGVANERSFSDPLNFRLDLTLRRNPDLLHNQQQPLIIWDFTINYETRPN